MTTLLEVSGTDLRYLLTAYLFDHGPATVNELVEALTYHGFRTVGRASKSVSDALRWEMAHGRLIRFRRGRYRPGMYAAGNRVSSSAYERYMTKSLRCRSEAGRTLVRAFRRPEVS